MTDSPGRPERDVLHLEPEEPGLLGQRCHFVTISPRSLTVHAQVFTLRGGSRNTVAREGGMDQNTDTFDPYHRWLGISPKDQPPNHYRLLAIDLFESDPEVIRDGADQMTHVRKYQLGKHTAVSRSVQRDRRPRGSACSTPRRRRPMTRRCGPKSLRRYKCPHRPPLICCRWRFKLNHCRLPNHSHGGTPRRCEALAVQGIARWRQFNGGSAWRLQS